MSNDQTGTEPGAYTTAEFEALMRELPSMMRVVIRDHRGTLRPAEAVVVRDRGSDVLEIREIGS